ncbi:DNA recombination protein RecO [Bacillus gaemokensis]|uniref:DNA recombination protein RecO n=1 Tax=Bacillus gaemokensis TaxID=574375 RepID=UPI0009E24D0E|nr:DNA recombination protein RecO [Bacillus gaemokensis]
MLWLILFLPAVIIWFTVIFIHIKFGKSNHHYHEPLIFYSQRISPFPIEKIEREHRDEIEKSYRKR